MRKDLQRIEEFFSRWLADFKKEIERLSKATEKIGGSVEELKKTIYQVQKTQDTLVSMLEENQKILDKLISQPPFQKGFAVVLDWLNLSLGLRDEKLNFPGQRLVDRLVELTGKPRIGAFAFCEGYLSDGIRNMLEESGFTCISCMDADETILKWLEYNLFSNERVETIFLITNDQRLIRRSRELASFFPEKNLIFMSLEGRLIKDPERRYFIKLYKRGEKHPLALEENPFTLTVQRIKEGRLTILPEDPYELFLLIVTRVLPELKTKTHKRGFHNLVNTIWEAYLYGNEAIQRNDSLKKIVSKDNLQLILGALLDQTDLIKKVEGDKIYYMVDTQSEFWKKCVSLFKEAEVERYIK